MQVAKTHKTIIAASLMLLFAFGAQAQMEEGSIIEDEQVSVQNSGHSPKKATLYSAIVPGLGQIYNKKYWKLPIVYGGLAASIYAIIWNTQQYNIYAEAFDTRVDGGQDQFYNIYSIPNLISLQNFYRNNRDLSVIIALAVYGLQILDANIDAHLFDFDVSEDLNIKAEPALLGGMFQSQTFGARITFNFK